MANNAEFLQISSIVPSNLSDQPASLNSESSGTEYDGSDVEEAGETAAGYSSSEEHPFRRQHHTIHAHRNDIATVEPTVIPTTYASFRLTAVSFIKIVCYSESVPSLPVQILLTFLWTIASQKSNQP